MAFSELLKQFTCVCKGQLTVPLVHLTGYYWDLKDQMFVCFLAYIWESKPSSPHRQKPAVKL